MITEFISTLASRMSSENSLSDITWTMCQVSDKFQQAFLDFFFGKGRVLVKNVVTFERESVEEDSRPDFKIETEDELFLVECKIWDKKQHFKQYISTFKIKPENLGYITNYPLSEEGFVVKTWSEFYKYIQKKIPKKEDEIWNGYLEYLQEVCGIYNFTTPMDIKGMYSLFEFYCKLDEVFAEDNEHFYSHLYDNRKNTGAGGNKCGKPRDGIMGKYFDLKLKLPYSKAIRGWMGVYFRDEDPTICIGFSNRDGWGLPAYSILLQNDELLKTGKTFNEPYEEGNAYWFDFNKSDKFATLDLEGQVSLLKKFFKESIETVYTLKQKK